MQAVVSCRRMFGIATFSQLCSPGPRRGEGSCQLGAWAAMIFRFCTLEPCRTVISCRHSPAAVTISRPCAPGPRREVISCQRSSDLGAFLRSCSIFLCRGTMCQLGGFAPPSAPLHDYQRLLWCSRSASPPGTDHLRASAGHFRALWQLIAASPGIPDQRRDIQGAHRPDFKDGWRRSTNMAGKP